VLKGHSASSQRRIILVKSTQIRWFSRRSGGEGWSGRAVALVLDQQKISKTILEKAFFFILWHFYFVLFLCLKLEKWPSMRLIFFS
jgi:hypothetical protein